MKDFQYCAPTEIHFGRECLSQFAETILRFGQHPLLVYGGGSIKKSGLYQEITAVLQSHDIPWSELSGVEPNPRIESVRAGGRISREEMCDVVVAIGGGSCIDCAKAIAATARNSADAWDVICKKAAVEEVLSVISVLTMAGTGSEMSSICVISNLQTKEKVPLNHPLLRCKASFLNPELTYTLPPKQTAAGVADAFSHVMESYFSNVHEAYLQARCGEALMNTLYTYGPVALQQPQNYEARANIMWASTWAINNFLPSGNPVAWSMHAIEHELSAYYDITHGVGLAIIIPAWMRYVLREENAYRFSEYLQGVFHEPCGNMTQMEQAELAIQQTERFLREKLHLPAKLRDVGIEQEKLFEMAQNIGDQRLKNAFIPLKADDVYQILLAAY